MTTSLKFLIVSSLIVSYMSANAQSGIDPNVQEYGTETKLKYVVEKTVVEEQALEGSTEIMGKGNVQYATGGKYKADEWEYHYKNGQLAAKGKYLHDQMVGKWRFYYPNGNTAMYGFFAASNPKWTTGIRKRYKRQNYCVGPWTVFAGGEVHVKGEVNKRGLLHYSFNDVGIKLGETVMKEPKPANIPMGKVLEVKYTIYPFLIEDFLIPK